jgi:predicted TIM-barrel fold metal-dependent hydrolase
MPAPPPHPNVDVHLHLGQYWPDLPTYSYGPSVDFTVPGLLQELDAQRIGFGVLLQLETVPSVEETLHEAERKFADSGGRLLKTSTVDPVLGEEEVAKAIRLWERTKDLVAIKLYPGYKHFYPHDARLGPVYEFAHRRGIPIMIHQGDTLYPDGLVKYAQPLHVDEVAVRYRDVQFVQCHLGNPWIEETAEVVYKNPNVFTDTSGLLGPERLPYFERMVQRSVRRLEQAIDFLGSVDRVLYGSDWPLISIANAVRLIRELPVEPEAKDAILGGNARRLFHLSG